MYGSGFGRVAPVKVGEELDVKIEGVGEKGDGIARVQGFVLFVPGVKEGDEVRVSVTRVLRKVGFAEVVGKGKPKKEAKPKSEEETEEDFEEEAPTDTEDFGEDFEEDSEDF